ncbi:unnamed protein product [Protopolystoma xenopodis]|uniref:Uncharacterized protein n=1 Tax=Protopolystoma xenopodis TaxID=117903 RepID=A0A448XAR7_9PLAT|nr:unnamed protein product [Protopolystoma xenopodis]
MALSCSERLKTRCSPTLGQTEEVISSDRIQVLELQSVSSLSMQRPKWSLRHANRRHMNTILWVNLSVSVATARRPDNLEHAQQQGMDNKTVHPLASRDLTCPKPLSSFKARERER